ncbi:hypothetical protein, partial, partial [Parasitella parasitica]
ARKELPEDDFLDENEKSLVVGSILAIYPPNYTFLKSSIHYDVKANPLKHVKTFYKLGQLLKSLTFDSQTGNYKSFIVFPLRKSFVPAYITVDTLIMNYHILGAKAFKEEKSTIWQKVLNIKYKAFKKQNSLIFQGMLLTDGVGATVLKQNFDSGRRKKEQPSNFDEPPSSSSKGRGKASKKTINHKDEFEYIESLTKEKLKEIEGQCVLIDPGRRDILYCMKETSTVLNKQIFRFTKNQRNKKSRRLRYLRNQLKPDCIKSAELQLSKVPSATLDIEHFVQYLEKKLHVHIILIPLTLLLSVDHLSQRLTKEDVDSLNLIIKNVSIWLDNEKPSEVELESKKVEVKRCSVHSYKLLLNWVLTTEDARNQ